MMSAVSSAPPSRASSSEVHSLTSFGNPFDDEEADNSSYAIVSSLLSKVKSTFAGTQQTPGASTSTSSATTSYTTPRQPAEPQNPPTLKPVHPRVLNVRDRPTSLAALRRPAPPLVSMTPAMSELPSYLCEPEPPVSRSSDLTSFSPVENEASTSIPGFPIQDDTRSIRTSNSFKRFGSASKVIRRLRGDGLSKDYWMDDELCKECYDCKSTFTTWRRKHHCRICGQIYCSRCASNIIKGSRFGQDGVIRVCNLCLQMLEEDDDDDDTKSVTSVQSSPFPPHQLESVHSTYLGPQSPFSAQTLLSHSYDQHNLFAIPESASSHRRVSFDQPGEDDLSIEEEDSSSAVAPFRRNMDDDSKDTGPDTEEAMEQYLSDTETKSAPIKPSSGHITRPSVSITFPSVEDIRESSIHFPGTSSPDGADSPRPLRSRVSSFATDVDAMTPPFLRSRVPSRLAAFEMGEPGWRTRRESSAYAAELNAASMFHLRVMLRQLLTKANIPRIKEWEETLLKLSLRVASHLALNPRAPGASMDVRSYIKIKKIPGGTPRDSEYVDGAVITKNVAHKNMVRDISYPRIMLVTFPFDYHRVEGQFMAFDPLLAQEKDYLFNLVSRVAALRPHLVLVERSVSRLALDYLLAANIAVARTVKNNAIQFVARATQAQVLNSMDRLVLEPQMGHCSRFKIQTFDHPLIPGRRKTYMRFEGCSPDTACTIILRGEDIDTLKGIKAVTSFMMFIVRNLKMETFLWKDTIISMPTMTKEAAPPQFCEISAVPDEQDDDFAFESASNATFRSSIATGSVEIDTGLISATQAARRELSRRIQQSVEPYLTNFISASATLRFPPPYAIWRMKELDDRVRQLQREWEDAETAAILEEETGQSQSWQENSARRPSASAPPQSQPSNSSSDGEDGEDGPNTPLARVVGLPATESTESTPNQNQEHHLRHSFSQASMLSRTSSASSFNANTNMHSSLPSTESLDAPQGLVPLSKISRESALHEARFLHAEQRRIWEWYLRKNSDDFVVQKYQCIYVRHFIIPTLAMQLEPSCVAPKLTRIAYYGEHDCTLGQFIEDTIVEALDPHNVCTNEKCKKYSKHLNAHSKVYLHNESRVVIAAEPWIPASSNEITSLSPDKIASFSVCRVCLQTTPFIPVSEETLKYSFGKFLELHFYPADVQLIHGAGCEHNIYLHHIRYFAWRGMTVRFQTDHVDIHEIVLPPMRTIVQMESSLELKNRDYETLLSRNAAYWQSVVSRLEQLQLQARADSSLEKFGAPTTDAAIELLQRVEADRVDIARIIHRTYADSRPTDTLALGSVRSAIQNKVVQWDLELENFEKKYVSSRTRLLTEKDLRRMTGSHHFKRIYDDFFRQPMSSASEIDEKCDTRLEEPESTMFSEPESIQEKQPLPSYSQETETSLSVAELLVTQPTPADDGDSDSTISAHTHAQDDMAVSTGDPPEQPESPAGPSDGGPIAPVAPQPPESKLPRWQGTKMSVAELVRQFQSSQEESSLEYPVLEADETIAEQEYLPPLPEPRRRTKSSVSKSKVPKDSGASDFERGYAANIGPRHLTARRSSGKSTPLYGSRIPTPAPQPRNQVGLDSKRLNPSTVTKLRGMPDRKSSERDTPEVSPSKGKGKSPARHHISRVPSRSVIKSVKAPLASNTGKVSNIARQFERMSKDTERRRYAVMKGRKARPVAIARAKVEVFSNIKDMHDVVEDGSDEGSSSSSEADDEDDGDDDTGPLISSDPSVDKMAPTSEVTHTGALIEDVVSAPAALGPLVDVIPATPRDVPKDLAASSSSLEEASHIASTSPANTVDSTSSGHSGIDEPSLPAAMDTGHSTETGSSMIGTVSAWWRSTQNAIPLQYPFSTAEHVFAENSITVREDEPTSIIAFTLNSKDHRQAMSRTKPERMSNSSDSAEAFMPDTSSDSQSNWGVINIEDAPDLSELLKHPSQSMTHLSFQFESGGVAISCVVFCAEQFETLRRTCQCDHTVIESLARCLKWDASGGKSGSAFLKTRDDRFIAKEVSKTELDSMINFAPAYFDYMSDAIASKRPTLLAKIFGVYKIAYKNPMLNKTVRMNLLLMENLFYGRKFTRIYDLKGSMRNRRVQSTGKPNEVLLDENLMQTAHLLPFYLREHSKRIMRGAVWNDSKFLAKLNIMDYSLLVAVDNERNELVVGIVDYIRTYTWDKRLESWVKESAFLGGGPQREPTIVTPKQYKARFRAAMERYLPLVPDRWTKLDDAPDNEGDNLLEMWPDW